MRISRKAFSLIEVVVILAIMVILTTVALLNLNTNRNGTLLVDTGKQIATLLREAQSDAMSQNLNVAWGVHFANSTNTAPFYEIFSSSTYSTGTVTAHFALPSVIAY